MTEWISEEKAVLFSETDASRRVHFTAILRYTETAEHQLLEELGVGVFSSADGSGWPRVQVECQYLNPLKYGDLYQVGLKILKIGRSSLKWQFRIISGDQPVAEGEIVTAFVEGEKGATPIPTAWRQKLAPLEG